MPGSSSAIFSRSITLVSPKAGTRLCCAKTNQHTRMIQPLKLAVLALLAGLALLWSASIAKAQVDSRISISPPSSEAAPAPVRAAGRLIVHEFGVLTSIALPDGKRVSWSPLELVKPQPDFVEQFPMTSSDAVTRFELPAIFFRVDKPTDVAMHLRWLDGYFASCYPRGRMDSHNLSWSQTTIMPDSAFPLPVDASASHYYQARNTSASFVRVDYLGHKQYERFITLRGIGSANLPLNITISPDAFTLTQLGSTPVARALLIENIDRKLGFLAVKLSPDHASVVPRLTRDANIDLVTAELRQLLNEQGLYPDEASASVAAQKQNWFGPGVRVIYFLPRPMVDKQFQMSITPAPTEHLRLYAVCVELITPALIDNVKQQLATMDSDDNNAQINFMQSSPLIKPVLASLLEQMKGDSAHAHLCDKINLILKQPLAQK